MKKIMIMLVMLFSVLTTNAQVRVVSERHLLRATTEWVKLADNGTVSTYLRFVAEDHPGMDGADMCTYVDYKYINKKPSGIYTPANARGFVLAVYNMQYGQYGTFAGKSKNIKIKDGMINRVSMDFLTIQDIESWTTYILASGTAYYLGNGKYTKPNFVKISESTQMGLVRQARYLREFVQRW